MKNKMDEFGNYPEKKENYIKFWNRDSVSRPLVGFTKKGWLPVYEFEVTSNWEVDSTLTLDMVKPEDFMDDQEKMLREGALFDDDIIRGASPHQGIPWNCALLGGPVKIFPGSLLAEDLNYGLESIPEVKSDLSNPWLAKYIEYIDTLVKRSAGRYPISHGSVVGSSDLLVILRGHTETVFDMMDESKKGMVADILDKMTDLFINVRDAAWEHIPLWENGWYDAQYYIWSPGSIVRMQEDAVPLISPDLYREFLYPVDKRIADRYDNSFFHLHSTSLFLLDEFLRIESLKAFEVNKDVGGPPFEELIPSLQKIQKAGRSLIIRGEMEKDEIKLIMDSLDCRGLYLHLMVNSVEESKELRPLVGMD